MAKITYKIIMCNGYEKYDASQYKTISEYSSVTKFATELDAMITLLSAKKVVFNICIDVSPASGRYAYIEIFD